MRRAALLAVLMLAACSSTPGGSPPGDHATASRSASASAAATSAASPTPAASGGAIVPSPSPPPIASPVISCRAGASPPAMVMIGGYFEGDHVIYDVGDPLHPRLVCTITGTAAQLFTGDTFVYLKPVSRTETDVVLHSIGSGNESKVASFPANLTDPNLADIRDEAWTPDGSLLAYTVADETAYTVSVWLYSAGHARVVHSYGLGIGDCVCRFGLPPQVLAFSPDRQYLVDGRIAGKGSTPLTVIRVSDGAVVFTADPAVDEAIWNRTGHQLFLVGNGMQVWTPESGALAMSGQAWAVMPGLSPDGSTAAYTAYSDAITMLQPRVYTYDLKSQSTHLLIDKMRTQVLFVKDGWVWYLEEQDCGSTDNCGGSTSPTGAVFAMQLSTGVEQVVTFAASESPAALVEGMGGWLDVFSPGELWPAA